MKYSIQEILAAGRGTWPDAPEELFIDGYSLDSRSIKPGELFFAFEGDVQDGHKYVENAFENGACAAFVRHGFKRADGSEKDLIFCDDGLKSLHALASWSRDEAGLKIIGITGSCGKTTTKDILAGILPSSLKVSKNEGNLNNIWGLPIALLRRPEGQEIYVCEMGMSYAGELSQVTAIARPECAVFTNIAAVHLVNFNSVEEIAEAKAELLEGLKAGSPVVANADDDEVMRISRRSGFPMFTYGIEKSAELMVENIEDCGIDGTKFVLCHPGGRSTVQFNLPGIHNIYNLLAAVGAGITFNCDIDEMIERLHNIELSPFRSKIENFESGLTLFDDAYNSNPPALKFVMETFVNSNRFKRKIAVLGDMLELGPGEVEAHRDSGAEIAKMGLDLLITVGPLAAEMADAAGKNGMNSSKITSLETSAQAIPVLLDSLRPQDLVLVKGSRGVKMESIVEAIRDNQNNMENRV